MRGTRRVFLCLLLLAATVRLAHAGEGSTVFVRVGDGPGTPAVAWLASTSSGWAAEGRPSSGVIVFRGLAGGEYDLTVGGTATLRLRIEPAEQVAVEAVTDGRGGSVLRIRARSPEGIRTVFDAADLRGLPSGRDVLSLAETTDPVAVSDRIDGGGLFTADPARITLHGGSWTETTYLLDGIDISDPLRGGRPLVLPYDGALSSATLVSAAASIDLPGSAGVFDLALERAPKAWHGRIHADTTLGTPAGEASPPPRESLEEWRSLGFTGGGPVRGERLQVLGGFEWRESSRTERGSPAPLGSHLASALGQAVWRLTDRDTVRATALGQWGRRPSDPGVWRGAPADDSHLFAATHWERRNPGGGLWTTRVGYSRARTSGLVPVASIERLLDGPVAEHVEERPASRFRAEATGGFQFPVLRAGGTHDLRVALSASRSGALVEPFTAVVGERVAGTPARAWDYASAGAVRPQSSDLALVVSDRLRAGRIQADLGLRTDLVGGRDVGVTEALRWFGVSPALSVRWSALGDGDLVLWGAASRRAHRLLLSWLEWGDPAAPQASVRLWTDADRDGVVDPGEGGLVVGRAGPGAPAGSMDPGLRRPSTDELMVAIEGRIRRNLLVRFAGVDRRESGLIESVNVGLGPGAYTTRFLADPGGDIDGAADDQLLPVAERRAPGAADSFLLTNPPGLEARYRGVEITFDLRAGEWLRARLAGTAHRVDGEAASRGFRAIENDPGLVGELFDAPNADTNSEGRLFFDRAYTIKLSGLLRAPGDFHFGWVARYQDGQPFSRLVVVPGLPQGTDFVRAVPNGRHRFEFALTVDARLEKRLRIGSRRLSASIEAFNLLQNRHEVEEDVVSGPAFRTPTYAQPPRVFRAGVRVDF